jgi:hypothetical protein
MILRARAPLRALKTKAESGISARDFRIKSLKRKITRLFSQQLFANQIQRKQSSESQTTPIQPKTTLVNEETTMAKKMKKAAAKKAPKARKARKAVRKTAKKTARKAVRRKSAKRRKTAKKMAR